MEDNIKAVLEMSSMTKKEQEERLENLLDEFGLQRLEEAREYSFRVERRLANYQSSVAETKIHTP